MAKAKENIPHIGIFGRCNAGKSTLLNFITGADTAIVSPVGGTTTDPVRKSFEILGFSPVVLIDTAGVDDPTLLGNQRMARTAEVARSCDLALLVFRRWGGPEDRLLEIFAREEIPYITVYNGDGGETADIVLDLLSAGEAGRGRLLDLIKERLPDSSRTLIKMFGGRLEPGDHVVLVCPIDGGAPAGRMILPQVQALREVLDSHAVAHVVQPDELPALFSSGVAPVLAVTDSQVYGRVRKLVPSDTEVTTFSILLAAAKGDMDVYMSGLSVLDTLRDGDRILVCEFCSHQSSCDDIARVKIPGWIEKYTGRKLRFTYISAMEPMPEDSSSHALMLMCGGCMATATRIRRRIAQARGIGLPVTNFGLLIRKIQSPGSSE